MLRSGEDDILRQSTLDQNGHPKKPYPLRPYGPRSNWATECYKEAYDQLQILDPNNNELRIKNNKPLKEVYFEKVKIMAEDRDDWRKRFVYRI